MAIPRSKSKLATHVLGGRMVFTMLVLDPFLFAYFMACWVRFLCVQVVLLVVASNRDLR